MMKKVFALLVPVLLLAACGGGSSQPITEIVLDATDFAYSPVTVTITAGEPVLVTLKNIGVVEHDFVIEKITSDVVMMQDHGSDAHHAHGAEKAYDVHFSAQPGEASMVQLTVSEPGTYTFFCSVAGHKEAGMLGELIVLADEN
jgi:uncharacterized cupredoxin-like copper-binding protein